MESKTKSIFKNIIYIFRNRFLAFGALPKFHKITFLAGMTGIMISITALSFVIHDYIVSKNSYSELQSLYKQSVKRLEDKYLPSILTQIENTSNPLPSDSECSTDSPNDYFELKKESFDVLQKINQDIKGWIIIPDTNVNYPILQSKDNEYYLDRSYDRSPLINASIFMDFRNSLSDLNDNTILYGHNMKDGSMFRDVIYYKTKEFFDENRRISIDTPKGKYNWEVFSVYVTDVNFNYLMTKFSDQNDYSNFLNTIHNKSLFHSGVAVTNLDKILTLSTCSYEFENARTVVHARLVR